LPRQRLNYHLRQLEAEGLVELVEERKQRNCTERMVRAVARSYVIGPSALGGVAADPASVRDHASSAYLVAVAAEVIRDVASLRDRADRAGKRLATLALRTEVRFKTAALSRSAFFEHFKRTVGMPPMDYLLGWRMAVAKDLLRRQGLGVTEVALRVGYGSASTFSTAFSRHVGQPPSRYAREAAGSKRSAA
jgi:AraC-like DNA-binding protein